MFGEKDFQFISELGKLKEVIRYEGKFWDDYPISRKESVADHTWRMSILLCIFQNRIKITFDFEKTIKMILIHDLPEIITGDIPLIAPKRGNQEFEEEKQKKEMNAMIKLCKGNGEEFVLLFNEYEEQKTNEAKIVKYLDRIEGILQVYEYRKGDMGKKHFELSMKRWSSPKGYDDFLDSVITFLLEKIQKAFGDRETSQ